MWLAGARTGKYWRFIMPAHAKAHRTKEMVDVSIGDEKFKVSREKARALLIIFASDDDEESVPASEVFPDLADDKKRPGIVLRGLRERDELTQAQLAEKIDGHQSPIAAME